MASCHPGNGQIDLVEVYVNGLKVPAFVDPDNRELIHVDYSKPDPANTDPTLAVFYEVSPHEISNQGDG